MSLIEPIIMKSFKLQSDEIYQLSPAHGIMSHTHSADNSNSKSALYRHGIALSFHLRPAFVIICPQVLAVAVYKLNRVSS